MKHLLFLFFASGVTDLTRLLGGLILQNIVSVACSLFEDTPIRSFVFFCLFRVWFRLYPNPLAQFFCCTGYFPVTGGHI